MLEPEDALPFFQGSAGQLRGFVKPAGFSESSSQILGAGESFGMIFAQNPLPDFHAPPVKRFSLNVVADLQVKGRKIITAPTMSRDARAPGFAPVLPGNADRGNQPPRDQPFRSREIRQISLAGQRRWVLGTQARLKRVDQFPIERFPQKNSTPLFGKQIRKVVETGKEIRIIRPCRALHHFPGSPRQRLRRGEISFRNEDEGRIIETCEPFLPFRRESAGRPSRTFAGSRRRTPIRTAKGTTVASRPRSKKERVLMRAVLPASIFLKNLRKEATCAACRSMRFAQGQEMNALLRSKRADPLHAGFTLPGNSSAQRAKNLSNPARIPCTSILLGTSPVSLKG